MHLKDISPCLVNATSPDCSDWPTLPIALVTKLAIFVIGVSTVNVAMIQGFQSSENTISSWRIFPAHSHAF